jgi:hypothetical protein
MRQLFLAGVGIPAKSERRLKGAPIMNYKQTQEKVENCYKLLAFLSQVNKDLDDEGFHLCLGQTERLLKVPQKTLNNRIHYLEYMGLLTCTSGCYETGKHTKRYNITEKGAVLIKKPEFLQKYYLGLCSGYYDTRKEYPSKIIEGGYMGNNILYNIKSGNDFKDNIILNDHDLNLDLIDYYTLKINSIYKSNNLDLRLVNSCNEIKGRVYNALCFSKSGKKSYYDKNDYRLFRTDLLKAINLGNYTEVYDIKSEIPRVSYWLETGKFFEIKDFYDVDQLGREEAKKLSMRCYFDKSLKAGRHHWLLAKHKELARDMNINPKDFTLTEETKSEERTKFEIMWNHIHGLMKPVGPKIFHWTSLIELMVIDRMWEDYKVLIVNVYDGFYSNHDCGLLIERVLTEIIDELYKGLKK